MGNICISKFSRLFFFHHRENKLFETIRIGHLVDISTLNNKHQKQSQAVNFIQQFQVVKKVDQF